MQKKLYIISWLVSFVLLTALVFYIINDSQRVDNTAAEADQQRIEYFSRNYFRFLEDVQIETDVEKIAISISFVPEVGSFPVKEEIYQSVAYHALQIISFYPEVNQFRYIVLWDDQTKQEVLTMTIDEDAIKSITDIFYSEYMNQSNGLDTSYKNIFSAIIETEESKSWRDKVNPYSDIP